MPSKLSSVLLAVIVTYLLTTMLTPEPIPAVFGDTSDSGGDHLLIATGKMANLEADVLYAGTAPGLAAAVVQYNIRIHGRTPPGPQPVVIVIDGIESGDSATMAIE